jgi:GntR family transcriptional repressor for pyruvate dehydrogenase complex
MGIENMNDLPFKQVTRQDRLSIQVAEQIEEMILSQRIKIEDRLPPERELCNQFGVSRTVIREAMRILEAKGLLVSQGGSGTYVTALDTHDLSSSIGNYLVMQGDSVSYGKIMQVRKALEPQIAAIAAEQASPESIEILDTILKEMQKEINNTDEFANYDVQFHVELARATQNELFVALLSSFLDALYEVVLVSNLSDPNEWTLNLHRAIYENVKAKNPKAAADAMLFALNQEKPPAEEIE